MDQSLMQKLAISKQIMDAQEGIPNSGQGLPNYNIPQNVVNESQVPKNTQVDPMTQNLSEGSIMNSNLPDEIKKLMIENPIQKPDQGGVTLSNEIIEGAAKLINKNKKLPTTQKTTIQENNVDLRDMIRDIVRDTVKDVIKEELSDKIILSESGKDTKEKLVFKVGNHLFEGVVTKIKKIK